MIEADGFYGIRNRAMVELFYATGMRIAELVTIKMKQLDLENQLLRVFGYAAAPLSFMSGALLLAWFCTMDILQMSLPRDWMITVALGSLLLFAVVPGYYLRAGLGHYLKLPRPGLLGTVAAFVGLLFAITTIFSVLVWL